MKSAKTQNNWCEHSRLILLSLFIGLLFRLSSHSLQLLIVIKKPYFFNRRAYSALNPLTQEEKKQIVEAMSLSQGHWFKCPKGHVYAIGECGGAMQRSRCNECGAVIGGANHRLDEGNDLAPEMDGARHAAWSEQANLQNYNLRDGLLWKVTTATV